MNSGHRAEQDTESSPGTSPDRPPAPPEAPPTRPGELIRPAQRSAWPIVVGLVAVVLGSLGVLMRGLGVLTLISMRTLGGGEDSTFRSAALSPEWFGLSMASALVNLALAGALLWGGVALLQRRRSALRVLLVWSIVKIVVAVPDAAMSAMIQQADMAAARASGEIALPVGFGNGMLLFTVVLLLLQEVIVPIIMLVVLSLVNGDQEVWESAVGRPKPEAAESRGGR